MNISICITVFNEEETIGALLDSLSKQTIKPFEILIVDGYSTDDTVKIIRKYQKQNPRIKLFVKKCTRAQGRNYSVASAKSNIIAITDAGCVAHTDWLENITKPFLAPTVRKSGLVTSEDGVEIVGGFYKMIGQNAMQKAMSYFLGVMPSRFGNNFLPSTRSMAFKRSAWEKVGGFPETSQNSAEDTEFNYRAVKMGIRYARKKNAVVEWGMPATLVDFKNKIYNYAKWDGQYGIWWNPVQRFGSHNIKALFVLVRYLVGLVLVVFSFNNRFILFILLVFILFYILWSYLKVYKEFKNVRIGLWGTVLQLICDISVSCGFVSGILGRWVTTNRH